MAAVLHAQDRLQQLLIVGFAVDRVNGRGVDDQERRRIEVVEKASVSVAETLEGYATLRRLAASPAHIIPGHDPLVLARYPAARPGLEGWVARLDLEPKAA